MFYDCVNLTEINVCENNSVYASVDGVLYSKDFTELLCYPSNKKGNTYTIPDSVVRIGSYGFTNCSDLEYITIPEKVTHIGGLAFWYCSNLRSVTIPKSVTYIGYGTFIDCENLKDVYYTGTMQEWNAIDISDKNTYLTNATIHYNSTL